MIKSKQSLFFVLIASIVIHSILEFLFPSMFGDQYMQIHSMFNFIDGHGVSMSVVYPQDLSAIKLESLNLWPMGFIFFNYPLVQLFHSVTISVLILNLIFISLFFYSVYRILNLCFDQLSFNFKAIILLFFSIAIMPARYMGSTDLWCLGLIFYSIYLSLEILINHSLSKFKLIQYSILISISVCMMVTLRYTYWLMAFSAPGILLIYGLFVKRNLFKVSIFTFTLSAILSLVYVWYHYHYFGAINPSSLVVKESYEWVSLLRYNPLILNTLFRDSMIRNIFVKFFNEPLSLYLFQTLAHFFGFIIISPIIYFLYIRINQFKTKFSEFLQKKEVIFLIISLTVIIIDNFTIALSSIKYGILFYTDLYPLGYATVAEVRYFAPSLILFFIGIILFLSYSKTNFTTKYIKLFVGFGFGFAIIINILLLCSRFDRPVSKDIAKYLHTYDHNHKMYEYLKSTHKNYVYLPSPYSDLKDYYMATFANLPEVKNTNWNQLELKSTKQVNLITLVHKNDTTINQYKPKILIQSLKPEIDLVEFKIN